MKAKKIEKILKKAFKKEKFPEDTWHFDLHHALMRRLPEFSGNLNYLLGDYFRSIPNRCNEQFEVLHYWASHYKTKPSGYNISYMLANGILASIALDKKKEVEKFYSLYKENQKSYFESKKDREGFELKVEQYLSGKHKKMSDESLQACQNAKKSGVVKNLNDEEIGLLLQTQKQHIFSRRIFQNNNTGEVWAMSRDEEIYYFDGCKFTDNPFQIRIADTNSDSDQWLKAQQKCISESTKCDEQWLFWSGKHKYYWLKRYENRFFYYESTYFPNRGEALVLSPVFGRLKHSSDIGKILEIVKQSIPRSATYVDSYFQPKKGMFVRIHNPKKYAFEFGMGVYKNMWVELLYKSGVKAEVVKTFDSHELASIAFEEREAKRIKKGEGFYRLSLWNDLDQLNQL